jgi:type IV pilus assembly protein PilE
MKRKAGKKGFTLVELMVVVAIVAILVALALPSYARYVRKANRGEAQQLLVNWSNNQEIWRAAHTTYAGSGDIAVPTHDKYDFFVTIIPATAATAFILTADPKGDQAKDEERTEPCDPLTLDQSNDKTPPECW